MATYGRNVSLSSFFVPKECQADDVYEYVNRAISNPSAENIDKQRELFVSCQVKRGRVTAIAATVVIAVIIIIAMLSGSNSRFGYLIGGLLLIAGIWIGQVYMTKRTGNKTWEQKMVELERIRDETRIMNQGASEELILQKALIQARQEERQDRQFYALNNMSSGRSGGIRLF
jgi:hypothetical protein